MLLGFQWLSNLGWFVNADDAEIKNVGFQVRTETGLIRVQKFIDQGKNLLPLSS